MSSKAKAAKGSWTKLRCAEHGSLETVVRVTRTRREEGLFELSCGCSQTAGTKLPHSVAETESGDVS